MQTLASDNFQRANENPLSDGGNWAVYTPLTNNSLQLVSDSAQPTVLSGDNCSYWSGTTFPDDQWAQMTVGSYVNSGTITIDLFLRASLDTESFYLVQLGNGEYNVGYWLNGSETLLEANIASVAEGDIVLFSVQGTTLTLNINGTDVYTTTDSTLSSGTVAVYMYNSEDLSNVSITNFQAGDFSSGGATTSWLSINLNPSLKGAKH